ncbi:hypothetical protein [Paraflavitalea pollutisoli]|uniref:hypothetical protein n=1 Tax=Paraflavitalea pollutisoli TaxID=3034143 RepID=UPI0023ECE293|nr:hypothetical protein [Paraflavitalea sp. H1-2-19X]
MTYYIDAFWGNQHFFATEDYESYDQLVTMYSKLQRHLTQAAGFTLRVTVRPGNRATVPENEFAHDTSNGKGFIISLKSKYRKAILVAGQSYDLLIRKFHILFRALSHLLA